MLGDRLRLLRESKGWSMAEVARMTNTVYSTYFSYEVGDREPKHRFLVQMADIYGVTVDYLLGREDTPHVDAASTPLGDISDLPGEVLEDINDYIEMKRAQYLRKKDSQRGQTG